MHTISVMKKIVIALFFFLLAFYFVNPIFAKIGVGVGSGKIQVENKLKPGIIYELPLLAVLNTGDEEGDYEVSIAYHQDQPELRPKQEWFVFSPQKFYLKPGEVKNVSIKLDLPLKMEPGNYFAYLEAQPAKKSTTGQTSVGVAAAAKLYFTVEPASFFQGIFYKLLSLWKIYSPWSQRAAWALLIIALLLVFKRFFHIQVKSRPVKTKDTSKTEDE